MKTSFEQFTAASGNVAAITFMEQDGKLAVAMKWERITSTEQDRKEVEIWTLARYRDRIASDGRIQQASHVLES